MDNKLIVLIPAYEPSLAFIDLLKELKKNKLKVVVVNDGSGKEFFDIFNQVKKYAELIEYNDNMGKGYALKKGFKYIYDNYDKDNIIVTADCDGQHTVKDIIKIGNSCKKDNVLILGKRLRSNKTPLRSRFGNMITRFVFRISTGIDVYDTQTGLRAFKNVLVPIMLNIEGDRFEYEMNVLLQSSINNIKLKEINIETVYIDNNSGSHFKPIKDSFKIYKEIFKFLTSSFVSFLIDYMLYSILLLFTNKLLISNLFARLISAIVNFSINKRYVFNNKDKIFKQIIEYFVLALVIIFINSLMLNLFVNVLDINKFIAKIIVEIIMVFFSWTVQKKVIFYKK